MPWRRRTRGGAAGEYGSRPRQAASTRVPAPTTTSKSRERGAATGACSNPPARRGRGLRGRRGRARGGEGGAVGGFPATLRRSGVARNLPRAGPGPTPSEMTRFRRHRQRSDSRDGRRSAAQPALLTGCCTSWRSMPIPVELVVFDRDSGVDLADAVTASTAGPGAPPHRIGDNRYIDGGYRSPENADLAAGYKRVLVLAPLGGRTRAPLEWGMHLAAQADDLRAHGSRSKPSSRTAAPRRIRLQLQWTLQRVRPPPEVGYNQGQAPASHLTNFWR